MAALVGSPGQGNYAAANEALNAFAHMRTLEGLKGLSIAWGPWEGGGMATKVGESNVQRALPGVTPFSPMRGVHLLDVLASRACVE